MTDHPLSRLEEEIERLDRAAERHEEKAREIEQQYGVGVRPSWCSADIAIERATAARYKGEANKLREQRQVYIEGKWYDHH